MFVSQQAVRDISIQLIPLLDPASLFEMIVVDMVEPLIPRIESLFVQLDNLLTKSAPESRLPVPPDLMSLELLTDIIGIVDLMCLLQMGLKELAPIEYFGTLLDPVRTFFMTPPCFDLMVLRVFMPFPIILAAKCFGAGFEGTTIGARMTLLMLSIILLADSTTDGKMSILQITFSMQLLGTELTSHRLSLRAYGFRQECIGSTTFASPTVVAHVEPDICDQRLDFCYRNGFGTLTSFGSQRLQCLLDWNVDIHRFVGGFGQIFLNSQTARWAIV